MTERRVRQIDKHMGDLTILMMLLESATLDHPALFLSVRRRVPPNLSVKPLLFYDYLHSVDFPRQ